jgi:chemotaxis protein methyltransferase CheR
MGAAAALVQAPTRLSARAEQRLRELAREHTGIVLGPDKASLIAARVQKRLRALSLPDFEAYLSHLDAHPEELPQFVSVITTHTTSFFREPDHFPLVRAEVEAALAAGRRRVRMWCAAASTGQEPWTLAMVLAPLVEERGLDLQILATDIDARSLATAHRAVYSAALVKQIPADVREASFDRTPDGFRVKERVRRLVRYAPLNLVRPPYPMKGPLDLVMCRNVMIYLDAPARKQFVLETERLLRPGGLLLVGHSESVVGMGRQLHIVRPSVYRMPEGS